MSDLESTRPGWFWRGAGIALIILANALAVWDLQNPALPWWIVFINLVTLICGVVNFHLGTIRVRAAREHHEFMEEQRRKLAQLGGAA